MKFSIVSSPQYHTLMHFRVSVNCSCGNVHAFVSLSPLYSSALSSTYLLLSWCLPEYFITNVGHLEISVHPPKSMIPDTGPCLTQGRLLDVTYFQAGYPLGECLQLVCPNEDMSSCHRSPSVWTRVLPAATHSPKLCIS